MSTKVAGLAKKAGYTNIKVMLKGVPGWKKAKNLVVASDKQVTKGNIVLADLRAAGTYEKGHIARAVSTPLADLLDDDVELPENTKAPIVLYGASNADMKKAAKALKEFGYKKVSVMGTPLNKFIAKGNKLVAGASPEEVKWVRKLGKNEIGLKEFNAIVKNMPADKLILDVRGANEIADGMFKGAMNMPLDTIGKNIGKLPKNRELLVHCTSGARAEMAVDELKKKGLKARFLLAKISCSEGSCSAN